METVSVRVLNIPPEVPNERIENVLKGYGKVLSVETAVMKLRPTLNLEDTKLAQSKTTKLESKPQEEDKQIEGAACPIQEDNNEDQMYTEMNIEQQTYITTSSENSETDTIAETEDVSKSDSVHKEEKEMKRLKRKNSIVNEDFKNQISWHDEIMKEQTTQARNKEEETDDNVGLQDDSAGWLLARVDGFFHAIIGVPVNSSECPRRSPQRKLENIKDFKNIYSTYAEEILKT
ncbi:hypothetical protein C0J52_27822 [Blattella germanica]|nr:hypothetical protein C0J52_27822 [Blattella germanica]